MRGIFERLGATAKNHHHIGLNSAMQSDLRWWDTFLCNWNGVSIIPKGRLSSVTLHTDASGGVGCGAWWGTHWLQYK